MNYNEWHVFHLNCNFAAKHNHRASSWEMGSSVICMIRNLKKSSNDRRMRKIIGRIIKISMLEGFFLCVKVETFDVACM